MGSHGGARAKLAILGNYGGTSRPIAGMSDMFVHYASLRLNLKKKTISLPPQYPQPHSPARAQKESEKCSREVVLAETPHGEQPDPVC